MRLRIVLVLALLAGSLSVVGPVTATPTPPVIAANHSSRQCAEIIQGDDCHWCEPLEGWVILGYSSQATCPAGYEDLGFQGMTGKCRGYKSQFCCSDYAHHGNCEDLIINESEQLCAFVEEIGGCTLPDGWTSAGDATQWSGRCPFGNRWSPDIACVTMPKAAKPTATATATPSRTAMSLPTTAQEPSSVDRIRLAIVLGSAIALGGLFVTAVWLILKRRRQR